MGSDSLSHLRETSFNELLIEQSDPEHVQEWCTWSKNHCNRHDPSANTFEEFLIHHKEVVPATKSLTDELVSGCWWDQNDVSAHVRDGILYIHCHFWGNMEETEHLFCGPCATQLDKLPALSYTEIETLHKNFLSSDCEFARVVNAQCNWYLVVSEIITVLHDDDDDDDRYDLVS